MILPSARACAFLIALTLLAGCSAEATPTPTLTAPTAESPDIQATVDAAVARALTAVPTPSPIPTPAPTQTPTEEPDTQATVDAAVARALTAVPTPEPIPTPTPEPTPSPTPTPTPSPIPIPTPTPRPTPTPTPIPTSTPTPRPTSTPTPIPTPTPTPRPTPTACVDGYTIRYVQGPCPTPTPSPTPTPTPSPTPTPTPTPTPSPTPVRAYPPPVAPCPDFDENLRYTPDLAIDRVWLSTTTFPSDGQTTVWFTVRDLGGMQSERPGPYGVSRPYGTHFYLAWQVVIKSNSALWPFRVDGGTRPLDLPFFQRGQSRDFSYEFPTHGYGEYVGAAHFTVSVCLPDTNYNNNYKQVSFPVGN